MTVLWNCIDFLFIKNACLWFSFVYLISIQLLRHKIYIFNIFYIIFIYFVVCVCVCEQRINFLYFEIKFRRFRHPVLRLTKHTHTLVHIYPYIIYIYNYLHLGRGWWRIHTIIYVQLHTNKTLRTSLKCLYRVCIKKNGCLLGVMYACESECVCVFGVSCECACVLHLKLTTKG